MDNQLAVDAVGVTKTYGSLRAVDDITVKVAPGEVYGVLGPNGAGKTTFLRMLLGLIRPDAGTIRVFDRTWAHDGIATLDGVAGFIESPAFYPYLTGRQNLEGLALLDGSPRPGRLAEVLDVVDLADRADEKVRGYSYGMRQRLGVAASLIREPRLLVLDEPANGLDPAGIRDMRGLLRGYAERGGTVLLSSHLLHEVEQIADEMILIGHGRIVAQGDKKTLLAGARQGAAHSFVTAVDNQALANALTAKGITVASAGEGLRVESETVEIGRTALEAGVVLTDLRSGEGGLEDLFLELTSDTQREALA